MKKLFLYLTLILLVSSCQKDDEQDTSVSSGDSRALYVGNWVCVEESQIYATSTYPVIINPHSTITNRVVVDFFYNLQSSGALVQFEINGNNVNIFPQTVNGFNISGTGTMINSSEIHLSYTADDGSGQDNVTAIYTKTN